MNRLLLLVLPHTSWIFAGLILLLAVLGVPAFRRPAYWLTLSDQYFASAALALVLLPIIITGGIDLSVGSVAVFVSVVVGSLWRDLGFPIELAIFLGLWAGLFAGLTNGALVALGVWPLVATLATRELFRGLAYGLGGDSPVSRFPPELREVWRSTFLGLPLPLYGVALLALATWLLVQHTWIGRMVYAIGDNETAARFAAVPVRRIKLGLYTWSGLVAACCGVGLVLKYSAAKPDAEKSLELTAIACVVLGGVRVTGGAGHVVGTLLGIVTVSVLLAALTSVAPELRDTVTGALLVVVAITNEAAARWVAR